MAASRAAPGRKQAAAQTLGDPCRLKVPDGEFVDARSVCAAQVDPYSRSRLKGFESGNSTIQRTARFARESRTATVRPPSCNEPMSFGSWNRRRKSAEKGRDHVGIEVTGQYESRGRRRVFDTRSYDLTGTSRTLFSIMAVPFATATGAIRKSCQPLDETSTSPTRIVLNVFQPPVSGIVV